MVCVLLGLAAIGVGVVVLRDPPKHGMAGIFKLMAFGLFLIASGVGVLDAVAGHAGPAHVRLPRRPGPRAGAGRRVTPLGRRERRPPRPEQEGRLRAAKANPLASDVVTKPRRDHRRRGNKS